MKKVVTIEASITKASDNTISIRKRKTAAYARVSTEKDEQFSSYEAQVEYYTNLIKNDDKLMFVKVYTDEGISGTNTKHRKGFNEMISDALNGNIDLIITKSISRFARNTVDSLVAIRKLKEAGCEVYFEKENIYTFDSKGELLITIMSSLAQEESRSISENVTWGIRKRFSDGKYHMHYSEFLGYEKSSTGNITINDKESIIVKRIYMMYLEGYSLYNIASILTYENIKTPMGKDTWHSSVIKSILTNEKYIGDALLQKTISTDFLSKKRKKNEGEVNMYYVEGGHDAIISKDIFCKVKEKLKNPTKSRFYSNDKKYSKRIKCGTCGNWYSECNFISGGRLFTYWKCNKKNSRDYCFSKKLKITDIENIFKKAKRVILKNSTILTRCLKNLRVHDDLIIATKEEIKLNSDYLKYDNNNKVKSRKNELEKNLNSYYSINNFIDESINYVELVKEIKRRKLDSKFIDYVTIYDNYFSVVTNSGDVINIDY